MNKDENKVFVVTTGEYSDYTIGGFEKFAEWGLIRANTDFTDLTD